MPDTITTSVVVAARLDTHACNAPVFVDLEEVANAVPKHERRLRYSKRVRCPKLDLSSHVNAHGWV